MPRLPIAAIDLGSNTVRLLVASAAGEGLRRQVVRQETSRLGQALRPGGRFQPEAVARTLAVLARYRDEIAARGAKQVLVGATSAVREAADGPEFLDLVRERFGFETVLLSGAEEADLTAAGVMTALAPVPEEFLVFDLGGRSTEFILSRSGRTQESLSLGLGAVALTEGYLASDPPTAAEIRACRAEAAAVLARELAPLAREAERPVVVGTAGTVTTLAAVAQEMEVYEPERVNNFRLGREELAGLFERLAALRLADRARVRGLPPDRAEIIVAGAALVLEIMDFFEAEVLRVSDAGLLEGIWLVAAGQRSIS